MIIFQGQAVRFQEKNNFNAWNHVESGEVVSKICRRNDEILEQNPSETNRNFENSSLLQVHWTLRGFPVQTMFGSTLSVDSWRKKIDRYDKE